MVTSVSVKSSPKRSNEENTNSTAPTAAKCSTVDHAHPESKSRLAPKTYSAQLHQIKLVVKVIWHKAASPQHTDGEIVFAKSGANVHLIYTVHPNRHPHRVYWVFALVMFSLVLLRPSQSPYVGSRLNPWTPTHPVYTTGWSLFVTLCCSWFGTGRPMCEVPSHLNELFTLGYPLAVSGGLIIRLTKAAQL